jgi:hypothetical protein
MLRESVGFVPDFMPYNVASVHQSSKHDDPVEKSTGEPEKKDSETVRALAILSLLSVAIGRRRQT